MLLDSIGNVHEFFWSTLSIKKYDVYFLEVIDLHDASNYPA